MSLLADYIAEVDQIRKSWETEPLAVPWFRGHANHHWPLKPGFYRNFDQLEIERLMIQDFSLQANSHLDVRPRNSLEWLFIMQHYGAPTRLLDWTEGSLFALFFTVSDKKFTSEDGCVWLLNPRWLNENTCGYRFIPTSDHEILEGYMPRHVYEDNLDPDPVALKPICDTPRIFAQKGFFTLHGSDSRGLEDFPNRLEHYHLKKIHIRASHKGKLMKELLSTGISSSTLFPELPSISTDITQRYSLIET